MGNNKIISLKNLFQHLLSAGILSEWNTEFTLSYLVRNFQINRRNKAITKYLLNSPIIQGLHSVLPPGIRGEWFLCHQPGRGGQLLNFKSQGGDTFRGELILGSQAGENCFIMTNCWYFHKMLHLEFYKFCLRRYLIFF